MDPQSITEVQQLTEELLHKMGLSPNVTVEIGESAIVEIKLSFDEENNSEDSDRGMLIGYHGETLRSLQLLLGMLVNKNREEWVPVTVDIDNYRYRREEQLRALAQWIAEKVLYLKEPIALSPMNSADRRTVHMVIADMDSVESESSGSGNQRKVVIKPA